MGGGYSSRCSRLSEWKQALLTTCDNIDNVIKACATGTFPFSRCTGTHDTMMHPLLLPLSRPHPQCDDMTMRPCPCPLSSSLAPATQQRALSFPSSSSSPMTQRRALALSLLLSMHITTWCPPPTSIPPPPPPPHDNNDNDNVTMIQ